MRKVLSIVHKFGSRLNARIENHYGDDRELVFRARNLLSTSSTLMVILVALFAFFAFSGDALVDASTRRVLTWFILALTCIMGLCCHMALSNKLSWSRRILFALSISSTFIATLLTGVFPTSEAYPALLIPVVLAYCIYGGRMAGVVALSVPVFIAFQWGSTHLIGIDYPNVSSTANPDLNRAVILIATFLVAVFALFSFDQSNRWYIKMSQAAAEGKANFLANMSHEIRTPMNGVIGFSEVMLKTELDDRQKTFMDAIHSSGKSLLNIINDILDYSKIEAGRMEIHSKPFNLEDLLNDIITLLSITAGPKDVSIDLRYPKSLPRHFVGDAGRIRQIVMNLAGNAVKFTHDGRVLIKVDVRDRGGETRLRLDVHDTGIGIPEDKLSHIFEQFTQADTSTTQEYGGTGLGLTITKRLVELMDGRIKVKSELGVGSVFSFELDAPIAPSFKSSMLPAEGDITKNILLLPSATQPLTGYADQLVRAGYRPHMAPMNDQILAFIAGETFERDWLPAVLIGVSDTDKDYRPLLTAISNTPALSRITCIGAHGEDKSIPPYDPRLHYLISPDIAAEDLEAIITNPAPVQDDLQIAV